MLTRQTQIPTHARGKVRALVKAHTQWPAFLIEKDLISAQARNADLIEFALRHPQLAAQIVMLIYRARPALVATNAVPAPESTVYVIERLLREFQAKRDRSPAEGGTEVHARQGKPRVRVQAGKAIT